MFKYIEGLFVQDPNIKQAFKFLFKSAILLLLNKVFYSRMHQNIMCRCALALGGIWIRKFKCKGVI